MKRIVFVALVLLAGFLAGAASNRFLEQADAAAPQAAQSSPQRDAILRANRLFAEHLLLMKVEDRAALNALARYVGGDWEKFLHLETAKKRNALTMPFYEQMVYVEHQADLQAWGRTQVPGGFAPVPEQ